MQFHKAERQKAKLRLALTGPSGSGKTWGALLIAKGMGGKIAVIDTERGSASLYAHLADFDVLELAPPYAPERFIDAVHAAERLGYDVLVIDSASHEWNGVGGCLEIVDHLGQTKYRGNNWSAWSDVTPRHRAFLDCLLRSKLHIIATMRSKTETAQTQENGKTKVVKLGMKSEQRDGIEYEFTTVLDLSHEGHYAVASKDRTGLFAGDPQIVSEETGSRLLAWLESGAEARQAPSPPPQPPVPQSPAAQVSRKTPSQAKRDGDDVRYREVIDQLDAQGVEEWKQHFDRLTASAPPQWLDGIRDRLTLREEELQSEARAKEGEAELDDAFSGAIGGRSAAGMAGRNGHMEAAE